VEATLVVAFTPELQRLTAAEFAAGYLRAIGVEAVAAGPDFRFGRKREGDLGTLADLGFTILPVEQVPNVSSTAIRELIGAGDVAAAAQMLARPYELDGIVVTGDQRGGTLGYPTANIAQDPSLLFPAEGVYAGFSRGHRAAISIGRNPHYGGTERRIEPYLLDFDGNLYGERLVVELWKRLREQAVFDSEQALVEQIARDVEATRTARRPVAAAGSSEPR
jgi:riboflavin kinase/FMN adenylyltransferase